MEVERTADLVFDEVDAGVGGEALHLEAHAARLSKETGRSVTVEDVEALAGELGVPTFMLLLYGVAGSPGYNVTRGPQVYKLYASTVHGRILRFTPNADGTLSAPEIFTSLAGFERCGARLVFVRSWQEAGMRRLRRP